MTYVTDLVDSGKIVIKEEIPGIGEKKQIIAALEKYHLQ